MNTKKVLFPSLALFVLTLSFLALSGCGYTTRSLLNPNLKNIYVDNFTNSIKITAEQSNLRMYRGYRPGMEVNLTKATIDKFIADGNLTVSGEKEADLILRADLTDFERQPLRYDTNGNVEEYRIKLIINMMLDDVKAGKQMWQENGFAGETTYRTGGSLAKSESTAVEDAVKDLARRIVERTIENW